MLLLGKSVRVTASELPHLAGVCGRVIHQKVHATTLSDQGKIHHLTHRWVVSLGDSLYTNLRRNIRRIGNKKGYYYFEYD